MKVTIFSQYQHDVLAKTLRKIFALFGFRTDLMRLSSTLNEDLVPLQSDAFLILLPPYWEIQPSFLFPLFTLVASAPDDANLDPQHLPAPRNNDRLAAKQQLLRKCFVISVGPVSFIRPSLSLNLAEILAALKIQSRRCDLGVSHLDQTALLDLVEAIASVVQHSRDPRLWADFLKLLIPFRDFVAFREIQRTIRASLASERSGETLAMIAGFLNAGSRETVVNCLFPLETSA